MNPSHRKGTDGRTTSDRRDVVCAIRTQAFYMYPRPDIRFGNYLQGDLPSMEPFRFEARISEVMMNTVWQVIHVPLDVEREFGARSGVDVCGTLDGLPYRRSLISDGQGGWFFVLNAAMRKAIGKSLGDTVQVVLQRDESYREVTLPDYFLEVLAEHPLAMKALEKTPPSTRRWLLEFLTKPKSMEVRARRVLKAIEVLEKQAGRKK